MLGPGDGIAIASVAGVVVAAIIKFKKSSLNGFYVRKETCDARAKGFSRELKLIESGLDRLSAQIDELNKYVREK